MTCDEAGCTSIAELADLAQNSITDSKRTINITHPSNNELRVPNCKAKATAPKKLVFSYAKGAPEAWEIYLENDKLFLSLGENYLEQFKRGILDISQGNGDYSIGTEGQELWFWWRVSG